MTTDVERKTRILVAKPGLDIHDRGALLLCKAFRDAGMEVIYSGLWQTPEKIAAAAIEEDVDAIAISLLDGQPVPIFKSILQELERKGGSSIRVVGGGTAITDKLRPQLEEMGIGGLQGPGTPIDVVVESVIGFLKTNRQS
ncbi:MAG: cobalamin-dependent protein [Chloroflexota bacterium]|nr:cobalamin-dependent protein [Chloroflexota bacterium]